MLIPILTGANAGLALYIALTVVANKAAPWRVVALYWLCVTTYWLLRAMGVG